MLQLEMTQFLSFTKEDKILEITLPNVSRHYPRAKRDRALRNEFFCKVDVRIDLFLVAKMKIHSNSMQLISNSFNLPSGNDNMLVLPFQAWRILSTTNCSVGFVRGILHCLLWIPNLITVHY